MDLTAGEMVLAAVVVTMGAILQGTIGFGLALIAAPVLVLLDPRFVPGPLILAGLPFMVLLGWRERRSVDYRSIGVPLAGQLAGIVLALIVLGFSDVRILSRIVAGAVLLGAGLSISGLRLRPDKKSFLFGGILAGFMGTTSAIPGPALALIHQHVSPARMRGTLAPFFVVGSLVGLVGLVGTGQMGRAELLMGLWLVPAGLAGWVISAWTAPRVSESAMRPAVLVFACLAALALLYRSL